MSDSKPVGFLNSKTKELLPDDEMIVGTAWCRNCRDMITLWPVMFRDSKGIEWFVEEGQRINGLSIPRFFWRVIHPYSAKYREGSVVHDAACQSMDRPSVDVHRMLYEAWLANGGHWLKSWIMYKLVTWFGPQFSGKV